MIVEDLSLLVLSNEILLLLNYASQIPIDSRLKTHKKMQQSIIDLVEICFRKGIKDVILCPGSRSAALTINFVRSGHFNCYSISDERSAAFIGLGMAIKTQKTVALVCTSGSAVLNFAPAVSEAFFQEIPLLILTADRPAEWIHHALRLLTGG